MRTVSTFTARVAFLFIAAGLLFVLATPLSAQHVRLQTVSADIATVYTADAEEAASALPLRNAMPALRSGQLELRYPIRAQQFRVSGRVITEFIVNEKGRVIDITFLKKVGYDCEREVRRALRNARFQPALDAGGQPEPARYITAFEFRLDR